MSTTSDLVTSYADLLILQYRSKAKARAHVEAVVEPFLMDLLPGLIALAYDLETAVGVQLKVLGKYVGVPTNVQRTFTELVELDDDAYRQLIKIKIVQNFSGSALADIQTLLATFFPGVIQVFDHKNMTMGYYFDAEFGSQELAEVFVRGGYLPKPMGVQLNSVIYAAEALTTGFFAFRNEGRAPDLGVGFKRYGEDTTGPWLTYDEAIALP